MLSHHLLLSWHLWHPTTAIATIAKAHAVRAHATRALRYPSPPSWCPPMDPEPSPLTRQPKKKASNQSNVLSRHQASARIKHLVACPSSPGQPLTSPRLRGSEARLGWDWRRVVANRPACPSACLPATSTPVPLRFVQSSIHGRCRVSDAAVSPLLMPCRSICVLVVRRRAPPSVASCQTLRAGTGAVQSH